MYAQNMNRRYFIYYLAAVAGLASRADLADAMGQRQQQAKKPSLQSQILEKVKNLEEKLLPDRLLPDASPGQNVGYQVASELREDLGKLTQRFGLGMSLNGFIAYSFMDELVFEDLTDPSITDPFWNTRFIFYSNDTVTKVEGHYFPRFTRFSIANDNGKEVVKEDSNPPNATFSYIPGLKEGSIFAYDNFSALVSRISYVNRERGRLRRVIGGKKSDLHRDDEMTYINHPVDGNKFRYAHDHIASIGDAMLDAYGLAANFGVTLDGISASIDAYPEFIRLSYFSGWNSAQGLREITSIRINHDGKAIKTEMTKEYGKPDSFSLPKDLMPIIQR